MPWWSGELAGANLFARAHPLAAGDCGWCLRFAWIGRDSFHGRVCTPGRLQRRGAMLRETPLPPRRVTSFLVSPRKEAKKATRLHRSFAARMTPLRCSKWAAGAELAGVAGSDSRAGLPRPLLRCSAAQTGFPESSRHCGSNRQPRLVPSACAARTRATISGRTSPARPPAGFRRPAPAPAAARSRLPHPARPSCAAW